MSNSANEKRRSLNKKILISVGAVFALLVVIGLVAGEGAEDTTGAVGESEQSPEPTTAPEPADDIASAEAEPAAPKPPKGVRVHTAPGTEGEIVFAEFDIADSLTKGMIRRGAQDKTVEILKFARDAYPDAARVFVQGRFPMTDQYGNTSDSIILNAGYDQSTLQRINFDGVDRGRIWDLRDAGMVHSELQG